MPFKVARRKAILYSLISSVLLIQLIVAIFFYNEYFNGKKLDAIETQIAQSNAIEQLAKESKADFIRAQNYLRVYFVNHDKANLDGYFVSLQQMADKLKKFRQYEEITPELEKYIQNSNKEVRSLAKLTQLIDSTRQAYDAMEGITALPKIQDLKVKIPESKLDIQVERKSEKLDKKGLFGRIADAIKGEQVVKNDTVFITTSAGSSVNVAQLEQDLHRVINQANKQFASKIDKFQEKVATIEKNNKLLYNLFDRLLVSSNGLIDAYDVAIKSYKNELTERYDKQLNQNDNIRSYAVLGLLILMFLVSIIIVYYIKQSFDYERKLQHANTEIHKNLDFKNRIIGMISHEMRAPMQILNIFMNRISKATDDPKVLNYLKSMKFTNNSLLIQANQILEFSKDREKQLSLQNAEFNLKEKIETALIAFKAFAESHNNQLIVIDKITPNLEVYSDFAKIHQLLTNILGNANKFTEHGSITVTAHSQLTTANKVELAMSIVDTGSGISESDLEEIFKPYYQGVISDKVENIGAGLGLHLCKEIVELFDGEIHATSELGKGTGIDFKIYLNSTKNGTL